jgi:hypothetical protein
MALETNIPIGGAQQRIEKLPAAPLQLPKEGGPFILDQGVIDGMYVSLPFNHGYYTPKRLTSNSIPRASDKAHSSCQLCSFDRQFDGQT